MQQYDTRNLRTIALTGHGSSGKTTLVEQLLLLSGAINERGRVSKGTTVSDHDPLEKTTGKSMRSSVMHMDIGHTRVHMIDLPGYLDFIGQDIAALDAVETVAVVINASAGVELVAQRMMQWAQKRDLCRLVIVNKIDVENADLPGVLAAIQEAFGKQCLPINLPARGGKEVIDCFFNPTGESDLMSVQEVHQALVDQVIELDEGLMAKYLEQGEEIRPEQLHAPFERALREGHLIPVCFTSAETGAGLKDLLDIFVRLLPNPEEGNPPLLLRGPAKDAEVYPCEPDPGKHVIAHVFKIVMDPYVGKLSIFRVHQGTVRRDMSLFVGDSRKPFKVAHLYLMQGSKMAEVDEAVPGDIVAVTKIDEINFNSILHDSHDEDCICLKPQEFPQAMFGLAISPSTRGDEQRLADALAKMVTEDPTLKLEHDAVMNETVLRGLGELHLRSALDRLQTQYKLEVQTRPPRIPFRETITARAEGHHRHKKQSGGAGQFGEVFLRVEPLERGAGFEFVDAVKGGVIPYQYIPAVQKGIEQVLLAGPQAGFPVQDVRVTVYDGKHHSVDSKEVAFVAAGKKAFLDAIEKARPVVLEPIVRLLVTTPADKVGDVTGDLAARRGQISGTNTSRSGHMMIEATAPLSELDGYSARLSGMTSGHGYWTMVLSHYEVAPQKLQQQLVDEYQKVRKSDED